MDDILQRIEKATDAESKIYLNAVLARRRMLLDGGTILYKEITKEEQKHIMDIMKRVEQIKKEEV